MTRDPDRLAWLALLIVDEAAEQAEKGEVVERSTSLRLALAYLYSIADGPIYALPNRRFMFDAFWAAVTTEGQGSTPHLASYTRSTHVRTCLHAMGRQLRYGESIFYAVRKSRAPEHKARRLMAKAIEQLEEEREQKRWRKREGYFGRPKPD